MQNKSKTQTHKSGFESHMLYSEIRLRTPQTFRSIANGRQTSDKLDAWNRSTKKSTIFTLGAVYMISTTARPADRPVGCGRPHTRNPSRDEERRRTGNREERRDRGMGLRYWRSRLRRLCPVALSGQFIRLITDAKLARSLSPSLLPRDFGRLILTAIYIAVASRSTRFCSR